MGTSVSGISHTACKGLYVVCRDIEAGLGEEWAAKGRIGSGQRPHFWRGSHAQQAGGHSEMVPVAGGAPVSNNKTAGNNAVNSAAPTGWV